MRKYFLALILIFNCIDAGAISRLPVSRHWENAWWGGGGSYVGLLPDNTTANKIYTISDVAGQFISTDKGENWSFMNNGTTTIINSAIAQSETTPKTMYILGKQLIKTTDGGEIWHQVGEDFKNTKSYKSIAIDRNNPDIVYVGTLDGKIHKTTDGGENWSDYATPFGVNVIPTFLYINKASTYLIVGSLSSGMMRYKLSDASTTAITLSGTNALKNWDFSTYTVSGTEHLCVGAGFHVSCTTDNGDNWTDMADITADSNFFVAPSSLLTTAIFVP